jgi:hypothetical protein
VTVPDRGAVRVVLALRADDPVDLGLQQLVQHAEPDAHAERQQPLLRRARQLAQRVLHPLRQPLDATFADLHVGIVIYGLHAVLLSSRTWFRRLSRSQAERTRPGGPPSFKFYELRDNLSPRTPTRRAPPGITRVGSASIRCW